MVTYLQTKWLKTCFVTYYRANGGVVEVGRAVRVEEGRVKNGCREYCPPNWLDTKLIMFSSLLTKSIMGRPICGIDFRGRHHPTDWRKGPI